MSNTDFSVDSSSSWDYDEVIKPPKWILPVGIASVSLGAIWSVVCLLDLIEIVDIGFIEQRFLEGLAGYVLTLLVPSFLIVELRRFQIKTSKESTGRYDSYAGLQLANRLKYVAVIGFTFALIAIYLLVWKWSLS
jgi:hypothetical protein